MIDLAQYWLYAGAITAALFLTFGIDRIDPDARGAYIFRPLLVPGILLLWPLVLHRWWTLETHRDRWPLRHRPERRTHRAWALLAFLIPAIALTAVAIRQQPPTTPPERLE